MAGQLQIVGAWIGAAGGKGQWEVPTASGTKAMPEVRDILLVANTDFKVAVPAEAVAWSVSFQATGSAAEVKVRTNLNSGDAGLPISSLAGAKMDLVSGTTELIFKSPNPPVVFQIFFV